MKERMLTLSLCFLTGFMFIAVGVLTAADVPDEVKIENPGYKSDKKGAVLLSHKKHQVDYKVACIECHHDYKDGKNVWKEGDPVKKCIECHDTNKKQGKIDKSQNAFHKNCKDCHKEQTKAGKKNAPYKKCNDCHQKK
jgi:hypothetical protein